MIDTDIAKFAADTEEALIFYERHYGNGGFWLLPSGNKVEPLGDKLKPRRCRFCGQGRPKVSFKSFAHAIPELLGNKDLSVLYECDLCNHRFGNSYEQSLGNYTHPIRTFSRIMGKKGVPRLEVNGRWSITDDDGHLHFIHTEDDPDFELNEETKTWTMNLPRGNYRPLYVLKALVRIGLSLISKKDINYFEKALEWIDNVKGELPLYEKQGFSWQFAPGPSSAKKILATIMIRKNDYALVPFCQLLLTFGSYTFQVPIPTKEKDWYLKGSLSYPFFPIADVDMVTRYGLPQRRNEDFSDYLVRSGEKIRLGASYDERIQVM